MNAQTYFSYVRPSIARLYTIIYTPTHQSLHLHSVLTCKPTTSRKTLASGHVHSSDIFRAASKRILCLYRVISSPRLLFL